MDVPSGELGENIDEKSGLKLGWFKGVYVKCLLNIWGVMLFLRLSWVVGQAGAIEALSIITLANLVTLITAISMSAVSTNGKIKGGGIYYMLSRSLGLVTNRTFSSAELFSQTSAVWFGPNDRTFFCRTQNFFLCYILHFSKLLA